MNVLLLNHKIVIVNIIKMESTQMSAKRNLTKLWHVCKVNKINELQLHLKIWKISET